MVSRTLLRGGTTEAMMMCWIADTSIPASARSVRAWMPYSSTVRSRTVVSRQCATRRAVSNTPRTVLVFPTSITRSMVSPPPPSCSIHTTARGPLARASGPQRLDDLSERNAHRATVRQLQEQRALLVHAGHLPLETPPGGLDHDGATVGQRRERFPLAQRVGHGDRRREREQRGARRRHVRPQDERDVDPQPRRRVPCPLAPAAAARLLLRQDGRPFRLAGCGQVERPVVRRTDRRVVE